MERFLSGSGALLYEQYSAARRWSASDRIAGGDDAYAKSIHREPGDCEESKGRDHWRRHAGGADLRALGKGTRPEVLVADQGQARFLRGAADRRGYRGAKADEFPAGASRGRTRYMYQDCGRGEGKGGRTQGARAHAPKRRPRLIRLVGKTRRLPGKRSIEVRALHRRRRFRRWVSETRPRPKVPGYPSAQREDPECRAGAAGEDAVLTGNRHPDTNAGYGNRGRGIRRRQVALPPHHHHDRRRRRRRAHTHAAAHFLLPPDARTRGAWPHLHRPAAAVQDEARQDGALPQG